MLDDWEILHGLSPSNAADATLDADNDGFINLHEYWAGTDPNDLVILNSACDFDHGPMVVGGGAWEGATPEPVSGILLLLGGALLALRRRRRGITP